MENIFNRRKAPAGAYEFASTMANYLGNPNSGLDHSIYEIGQTPDQLKRSLWASWEGKNDIFTRLYLERLTTRGAFIRNLLPIETDAASLSKYEVRVSGDKVEYDTWSCEPALIGDQSARNMGRTTTSTRNSFAASFSGSGVGFVVPMDFLESPTKTRAFGLEMTRMNESVVLTWMFRVLLAIVDNGLARRARVIKEKGPLNALEFKRELLSQTNRTFALRKNGSGFRGVEAHAVDICRMRGADVDTVIIPAGATIAEHVEKSYSGVYNKEGKHAYPENKNLEPEGNRTKFHNLAVFESRRFRTEQGPPVDPSSGVTTVSQRYVMLPSNVTGSLKGYQTCHRDIEIPNGDDNTWTRISLFEALKHCGMWGPRSSDYPMTQTGIKLLEACCDLDIDDDSSGNNHPGRPDAPGSMRSKWNMPDSAEFNAQCTAYRLFKQADILNDAISIICGFNAAEALQFRETMHPTEETLKQQRVDERTTPGLGRKPMNTRIRASRGSRYGGLVGSNRTTQPRAQPQAQPRRRQRSASGPANTGNSTVDAVLNQLFANEFSFRIRRTLENLTGDNSGWILPVITENVAHDRSPTILYTEQTPPRSALEASSDPYWKALARVMNSRDPNLGQFSKTARETLIGLYNELSKEQGDDDWIQDTQNKYWKLINVKVAPGIIKYTSVWSLLGRFSTMGQFITSTPTTMNADAMDALNNISAAVMVRGAYDDAAYGAVKAFVMHCIDQTDPLVVDDAFVNVLDGLAPVQGEVSDPKRNIETIVDFTTRNQDLFSEYEKESMRSVGLVSGKRGRDTNGSGELARPSKRVSPTFTRKSVIELLKRTHPDYNFFNAILRHNVPCPVSVILFRMHVRIASSAIVFMVRGAKTGVVAIKDGALMFTRSDNDFSIRVSTRFKSGVFIFQPKNIEVIPDAFPTAYLGGAGARMYDPSDENDVRNYRNSVIHKDIFAHMVPYTWKPTTPWTDITGKMNPAVYAGSEHDNGVQYTTCNIYKNKWGHQHTNETVFVQARRAQATWRPTLALQSTQRVYSGASNTSELTCVITGHCAMGENCTPNDFKILQGSAAAFGGSGLESTVARV